MDITLTLDDSVLAQLNAAIEEMKKTPTVVELGVDVTYEMVARAALVRGLKTFKGAPEPVQEKPKPRQGPKAEAKKKSEPPPESDAKVVTTDDGKIVPPSGWQKWSAGERVPTSQADCHAYYERNGWSRWWGDSGRETLSFYWCPTVDEQEGLEPFPVASPSGKKVLVQETPWGPGHIIPHGW